MGTFPFFLFSLQGVRRVFMRRSEDSLHNWENADRINYEGVEFTLTMRLVPETARRFEVKFEKEPNQHPTKKYKAVVSSGSSADPAAFSCAFSDKSRDFDYPQDVVMSPLVT